MLLGGREDKKKANNASSRLKASRDSMSYIQWPQILTQILGWGEKICKRRRKIVGRNVLSPLAAIVLPVR